MLVCVWYVCYVCLRVCVCVYVCLYKHTREKFHRRYHSAQQELKERYTVFWIYFESFLYISGEGGSMAIDDLCEGVYFLFVWGQVFCG